MKYRDLIESCDMILESPTIKMFDQYMFISNLKDFYLESHNYIIDNIMSLPYNFTNDICNTYFIEEVKEVDGSDSKNKDGDKKKKSTSSDTKWDKDKSGQFKYNEGENWFIRVIKSIANFFIRIGKAFVGFFATMFNSDSVNNLAKARNEVANSANQPSAPGAVLSAPGILQNVDGLLVNIGNSAYLKSEFDSIHQGLTEIVQELAYSSKSKEEYETTENNWESPTIGELVNDNYASLSLASTLKLKDEYMGAKIRVIKYEATDANNPANAYADGGSKAGEANNYTVENLTESLLINYINQYVERDSSYKSATEAEAKNKAKQAAIKNFMGQNNINSAPIKVLKNFKVYMRTQNGVDIENFISGIRGCMASSNMSDKERAFHQIISSLLQTTIKSLFGILDSCVSTIEKMVNKLKEVKNDNSTKTDAVSTELKTYNDSDDAAIISEVTNIGTTLFDDSGNNTFKSLLVSMSNAFKNKDNKENIGNEITTGPKDKYLANKSIADKSVIEKPNSQTKEINDDFTGSIGGELFTSILMLIANDIKYDLIGIEEPKYKTIENKITAIMLQQQNNLSLL